RCPRRPVPCCAAFPSTGTAYSAQKEPFHISDGNNREAAASGSWQFRTRVLSAHSFALTKLQRYEFRRIVNNLITRTERFGFHACSVSVLLTVGAVTTNIAKP